MPSRRPRVVAHRRALSNALADSDINSGPRRAEDMIFVSPGRYRIFELANGSYIMHPSLRSTPWSPRPSCSGCVPALAPEGSQAARLLRDDVHHDVVVYVAPITTFLGDNVVLPGQSGALPGRPARVHLTLGGYCGPRRGTRSGWFGIRVRLALSRGRCRSCW